MKVSTLIARASLTSLVLVGVLAGCESGGGQYRRPEGWVAPEGAPGVTAKPAAKPAPVAAKPAPAPAAPAAKPAPAPAAPAPAMAGGDVMYLPTGDRNTSALSLRCGMPREVIANQNFTYDIEVCNLTGMSLTGVIVNYTLDGAKIVTAEPAASGNNFMVGDLAPRACKTIKVTASAAGTGAVRGCTSATWNNTLCCGTNVVQPALKLVKAVTPAEITPCDTVTYTLTVTNTGSGNASNVKIMDKLPAGVTSDGKSDLNWDIGTLAAGQSATRTFSAKAAKTGTYNNDAQASADNGLTAASNQVTFAVKAPVLAITKSCPGTLRVGRPANFKITVTNNGDAPAAATVVEDNLPAGSTFVSASDGGALQGNKVVWNVGTLAPKASKELSLSLNVTGQGQIQNSASARCTCAEPVAANCSFGVQGAPDMRTFLDDSDGVVLINTNHVYTYSVGNQGQVPLTNVTCKITLPAGVSFVSAQGVNAPAAAGNVQTYSLGTLAVGQNKQFTFTVKAGAAGEILVVSETTCAELKTPVRDDEITNIVD